VGGAPIHARVIGHARVGLSASGSAKPVSLMLLLWQNAGVRRPVARASGGFGLENDEGGRSSAIAEIAVGAGQELCGPPQSFSLRGSFVFRLTARQQIEISA
jgi:hypothetical protein